MKLLNLVLFQIIVSMNIYPILNLTSFSAILTPGDDGMWPSEREIRKKYSEMNPFEKDWYAEQFGPMSHRIKKRRAKLEQLEEMDMAIEHELQEE